MTREGVDIRSVMPAGFRAGMLAGSVARICNILSFFVISALACWWIQGDADRKRHLRFRRYVRVFHNSLLSKGFRDTPNDSVFPVGETSWSRFLPPGFDVVRIGKTLRHPLSFAIVSRCNMHPRQQSDSRQAAHPWKGSRFSAEPRGAVKRCVGLSWQWVIFTRFWVKRYQECHFAPVHKWQGARI